MGPKMNIVDNLEAHGKEFDRLTSSKDKNVTDEHHENSDKKYSQVCSGIVNLCMTLDSSGKDVPSFELLKWALANWKTIASNHRNKMNLLQISFDKLDDLVCTSLFSPSFLVYYIKDSLHV